MQYWILLELAKTLIFMYVCKVVDSRKPKEKRKKKWEKPKWIRGCFLDPF